HALPFGIFFSAQYLQGLLWAKHIRDITEVNTANQLLGLHLSHQLPHRLAQRFGPKIPNGIYEGTHRQMDDALFRSQPTELTVARTTVPKRSEVIRNAVE